MNPLTPQILFEDPHLIVLSKPAGLLSQGEHSGDPNLVDWLRKYLGRNYVGLIHRLDRNVSGVMVVAKRTKAASRLTKALQEDQVKRIYLAWLCGKLEKAETWKDWLLKDSRTNTVKVVKRGLTPRGQTPKAAVLKVNPLRFQNGKEGPLTLAEFRLETGRSHQIRVQAAHHGHPIVGDGKYGNVGADPRVRPMDGDMHGPTHGSAPTAISRPLLHSWKIEFPHPMSQEVLRFEAPLPADFEAIEKSNG